jgi:hypothetical protein
MQPDWTSPANCSFAVEAQDLAHGDGDVVRDPEQRQVVLADQAACLQVGLDVLAPLEPVAAARLVHEDDGQELALAGLQQRERLEALVVRSEAAGKQSYRVRLLHKGHLAREEVPEVDQLRVARDGLIGALLERQADVHAERSLAPGAPLGGSHDAVAGARDDHPALLGHVLGEGVRLLPVGVAVRRARAPEDGHLAHGGVGGEDAEGVAQLLERTVQELELAAGRPLAQQAQGRDHDLARDLAVRFGATVEDALDQCLDRPVQLRVLERVAPSSGSRLRARVVAGQLLLLRGSGRAAGSEPCSIARMAASPLRCPEVPIRPQRPRASAPGGGGAPRRV